MATPSSHSYTPLPEQAQEDALHSTRLLQVEERPFQRVSRTLLGKDSLLKWPPAPGQLPSPPPEADGADAPTDRENSETHGKALDSFRATILLDFAALESSILRIQLLQASNERERARYAAEKASILATAQSVRENTVALRAQLAEALKVLELRKGYDELATKLLGESGKKGGLKTRQELGEEIAGLEKEVEELQVEGREFESVWEGRREAWERVVEEGKALVNVIKGVKDDADERMEEGDGEPGSSGKEGPSHIGTPAADGRTPAHTMGDGGRTPMVGVGGTPLPEDGRSPAPPTNKFLDVEGDVTASASASRNASPMLRPSDPQTDVDMGDDEPKAEEEPSRADQHLSADARAKAEMETETVPIDEVDQAQQQVETEVMDES